MGRSPSSMSHLMIFVFSFGLLSHLVPQETPAHMAIIAVTIIIVPAPFAPVKSQTSGPQHFLRWFECE